MQSHRSLQR